MTDVQSRVAQCFQSVFPDLPAAGLAGASQASLKEWDSVAHVTLLAAIAEEFQLELTDEAFESLNSFPLIVSFVQEQASGR